MVITKSEAAEILKEIAERNMSWSKDFGLDYSQKVITALLMGADSLQEENMKIKTLVKGPKCPAHIEMWIIRWKACRTWLEDTLRA